jgi:hypothetical protein
MQDKNTLPVGGEGYYKILSVNPQDARIYLWSEKMAMISGIGFVVGLAVALYAPFSDWSKGDFQTVGFYLWLLVGLSAPFLLLTSISAILHKKIGRKYNLT